MIIFRQAGFSGVTTGEPKRNVCPPAAPPRWRCAQYIISVKVKAWSLYILYWLMNNIKFRADEQKRCHRLFWRIKVHDFRADEQTKKNKKKTKQTDHQLFRRVKVTKLPYFRLIFLPDFFCRATPRKGLSQ